MKVLVETRDDSRIRPQLNMLAKATERLGHEVVRWSLDQRVIRDVPPFEAAILWNGLLLDHDRVRQAAIKTGGRIFYAELGWLPQDGPFQLDHRGVNAAASWCSSAITWKGSTDVLMSRGDFLVVLQCDADTQLTHFSPWFLDQPSWLRFLAEHVDLPVRVRTHPLCPPTAAIAKIVRDSGWQWDPWVRLRDSLGQAAAVATINSTVGLEAMARGLPVLVFGLAVFRQRGACWTLSADPSDLKRVCRLLKDGPGTATGLICEMQAAVLKRILTQQWWPTELPGRLAPILVLA